MRHTPISRSLNSDSSFVSMGNKEFRARSPRRSMPRRPLREKEQGFSSLCLHKQKPGNHFHDPSRLFRVQLEKLRTYFFGLDSGGTIPLIR